MEVVATLLDCWVFSPRVVLEGGGFCGFELFVMICDFDN